MATRGDKKGFQKVNVTDKMTATLDDSFRARLLAEVLRILKRPSPVENEIYEGD